MIKAKIKAKSKPRTKSTRGSNLSRDPKIRLDVEERKKRREGSKTNASKLPQALKNNLFKKGQTINAGGKVKMSDMTLQSKALMREVLVESIKETFFRANVDLIALNEDVNNPPIVRGLAQRALKFIETGDIGILEYISSISGIKNLADVPQDNALKDFLIETIIEHQQLKKENRERDENIVDVND